MPVRIVNIKEWVVALMCATLSIGCKKEGAAETPRVVKMAQPVPKSVSAVFTWYHDACNYSGTYDTEKYSQQQLEDTYYLWHRTGYLENAAPSVPVQLYEFDYAKSLAKLEEEYAEKKNRLERLVLIPGRKWEDLRILRLQELKDIHNFVRVCLDATANPSTLLNSPFSDACAKYASALNSLDAKIMETWRTLIEERAKSYGNESIERSYLLHYSESRKSPDSLAYAKIDIFHYGWYECADDKVRYVNEDGLKENFEKLFLTVKKDCPPDSEADGI